MQPAATILIVKSGISNHAASGILDELCLSKFGTFHAACPQPADNFRTYVQHLPCSRIKHNRAKPMFELASALFSIADVNEFRFARFYIVYEGVQLGRLESPPIVSGVSDMHPSDCPNVEETRNPMQTFSRKKCSHFSPTNFHLHFHMKSPSVFPVILLIKPKHGMLRATPPLFLSLYNVFLLCVIHLRRQTPG